MLTVVYWHIVVVNYDLDQPIRHQTIDPPCKFFIEKFFAL